MKKLINIENVSGIAELLKDINISQIQLDKQQEAHIYIDTFNQALQDFKKPFPQKASTIELFEWRLKELIATAQALFDILDKNIQQKILKKTGCKNLDEVN
jgi:hypothetical protein